MAIYVVTHKSYEFPTDEVYKPIVVGKALNNVVLDESLKPIYDDRDDNISYLNREFCELTALYWLWKNSDDEIIGISHYRRYFKSKIESGGFKGLSIYNQSDLNCANMDLDVIIPKKITLGKFSVIQQYFRSHYIKDIVLVRDCINKLFPDYIVSFDKVMKQTTLHPYNMMIAKKEIYNEYCEWLFTILFEYKDICDHSNYNLYQKRIFGFLAERLFTVWVFHNMKKFKFKEYDIVATENIPAIKSEIKDKIKMKADNCGFLFRRSIIKFLIYMTK